MATKDLIRKIKRKAKLNEQRRADVRFKKTMALLTAKRLLRTTLPIAPVAGMRVHIDDALWAGRNVEPRIIEVLPAAILHYRTNFLGLDKMPNDFAEVLRCIRQNQEAGPDFEGIPFQKMKFWANTELKDKRTKPISERKQLKTFRLSLTTLTKLKKLVAAGKYKDVTSAIEAAVQDL
jgi:hypothetical protein